MLVAALMKDQLRGPALGIGHESDLGVDDLQEEVTLAFGKQRRFRLVGSLRKQTVAFQRDGDDEIGGKLILAT
jgi:hypothetical protein